MAKTSSKDDYFGELKEWSKRKLEIIEKYLDGAVRILGSIDVVYYVDGFAGPGRYDDGSSGSPVRAVELAQRLRSDGKPYQLRCINVEEVPSRFANLEEATQGAVGIVTNLSGEFNKHVDTIIAETGSKPAVFFLDPFGVEGIDWEQLVKIIRRPSPTDLWIRFDAAYVRRLDGFHESSAPEAAGKRQLLLRTFGASDFDVLHGRLAGDNEDDRRAKAVLLYMDGIMSELVAAKGRAFVGAYPIRTIDGQVKYYLVFGGSHPKAASLATHIVYTVEDGYQRDVEEYRLQGLPQPSFFPALEPDQKDVDAAKAHKLAESLWQVCQGRTLSRLEACALVWRQWFGLIAVRHVTAAVKVLANSGRVTVISGRPSDDNASIRFTAQSAGDS